MAKQTPDEPASFDALFALAVRESRAGRLAEAAEAYRKLLAIRPATVEAHNNLGIILRSQGQLEQAIAGLSRPCSSGRTAQKRTTISA